jgi:tetratricopeptide (TPR) repeat protein
LKSERWLAGPIDAERLSLLGKMKATSLVRGGDLYASPLFRSRHGGRARKAQKRRLRFDLRQGTIPISSAIPKVLLCPLTNGFNASFTLFLPLVLAGASAAQAGAVEDCNQVREPNRQLRGCTAYIDSRPDQPGNLATAFLNRANIYARRTQYEKAFADYKRALELDPSNALIPYNVGNVPISTVALRASA